MSKEVKRYAERDAYELDKAGNYYCRHVSAMTGEGLHSKSDIAAELGWRDMQIDALLAERDAAQKDAERYRFARHIDNDMIMLSALQRVSGDALDEVIDAALQGAQP
jgi:hypothetical protein